MTHEEFRTKVLTLTETERMLKSGEFTQEEFIEQVLTDAIIDENGNYFFTNQKMTVLPNNYILRFPLSFPETGNKLRLLVHTRFTYVPMHYAESIGVHYVYSGHMNLNFDDGTQLTLSAGQLVIVNSGVLNSFTMPEEDDIILGIQIQKDYLQRDVLYGISASSTIANFLLKSMFGETTDFVYNVLDFNDDLRITNLMIDLFCEYLEPDVCSGELVENYMHIFFILLTRASASVQKPLREGEILEMLRYLEQNSATCSLASMAQHFGFTEKYISTLLKKTGHTYSELLLQARMQSACFLLCNTNVSIQSIAESVGYNNQTFFYRKFQKIYGMTPKEYREKKSAK